MRLRSFIWCLKMNRVIGIIFVLSFLGCSDKSISNKPKCQKINSELTKLKQEKRLNFAGKMSTLVINGYPYGKDEKSLNQRIKILEMELSSCNQSK